MQIGKTDTFERKYLNKFRNFASNFGEFVQYERDRGARDIGIHLTRKLSSGKENLSTTLCWFQLKGIMATTLPKDAYVNESEIGIPLKVEHLRYWYLQPLPTYMVLYIESVDEFLILNLKDFVEKKWGKNILTLDQTTIKINIPKSSVLDDQAFQLILRNGDIEQLKSILNTSSEQALTCIRDFNLICKIGESKDNEFEHKVEFIDWQSKLRVEIYFYEKQIDSDDEWLKIRGHLQYMLSIKDLEDEYPYLTFEANCEYEDDLSWDEANTYNEFVLQNGDLIHGKDFSEEYIRYELKFRFNSLGFQMYEWVQFFERIGLLEIDRNNYSIIDVAPWHSRDV
jgi:hypothetical protein